MDYYNLLESADGAPRFTEIAGNIDTFSHSIDISPRPEGWSRARYRLVACNHYGCSPPDEIGLEEVLDPGTGYAIPGNAYPFDYFGSAVALSGDGRTLVAGAPGEDSNATGVNGDRNNDSLERAGAAYIFTYDENRGSWMERDYLKASSASSLAMFGS